MKYESLSDAQKESLLRKEYELKKKSFRDIASLYNTYSNKIRRDAIKFKIKIRDKSSAQKNALKTGRSSHPTEGTERSQSTKDKIGHGVMTSWENLDSKTLAQRKEKAKKNWENLSDDVKENILHEANDAVRRASKTGSKLELFILNNLLNDGYNVEFHKEQTLLNTKLQLDLFLPKLSIVIEIDGPSHFQPVWGEETLKRNKGYDQKKTGLILGKGLSLIRIKQTRDFSKARSSLIYQKLLYCITQIQTSNIKHIEIGDE
jgi:very-short-patch-repair endonuclease